MAVRAPGIPRTVHIGDIIGESDNIEAIDTRNTLKRMIDEGAGSHHHQDAI